tara:strand:+ start:573 stop:689 length:117 start_codon:yes stop_codon:yes gene_type:complete
MVQSSGGLEWQKMDVVRQSMDDFRTSEKSRKKDWTFVN